MGKTKTHLPSQVEAEADWQGTGKTSVNGGAPQSVFQVQKAGILLDFSFSHMWIFFPLVMAVLCSSKRLC